MKIVSPIKADWFYDNKETKTNWFRFEYVTDYYPQNPPRKNLIYIDIAGKAWDNLLSACEVCSLYCINGRERRSDFFSAIKMADTGVQNE